MKLLYVLLILGLLFALGLTSWVAYDPGYVRISVGHWLVETNLFVMLALNLIFLFVFFIMVGLVKKFLRSQHVLVSLFRESGSSRARLRTERGLLAFLEGNWYEAKRLLGKSADKSETPIVNYLAAAHAASEQGDAKDAEQFLKKAYESNKDAEFAVGIAQAQIQLQKNQLEECLATLIRLKKQKEDHPFILKLLKAVYLKLEDWQHLTLLIPELRKANPEEKEELAKLEQTAWQNLFEQKALDLSKQSSVNESGDKLAELWQKVPDELRFDPQFISTYARQLIRLNCLNEAEVLLRKALNKTWDAQLIELYGLAASSKASEQLITAENWLKQRPNDASLLLTLGRLALRNELWGKAWEYFNASYTLQSNQQCLAELCRLAPRISEDEVKNKALMTSLLNSLQLPDLPLPK